ncbi:MAG: OprO/OprP family phosphate-selective porin [Bacteroidetes bacterium]|nr:OprO/OprP family phosphate-selective porin [Bacteroidota bacterium]
MRVFSTFLFLTGLQVLVYAQGTTTFGGYGELHYNKNTVSPGKPASDRTGQFDFHRFVLFAGHDFNDWVSFKSEFELEHAQVKSSNSQSEVSLEQAYIDLKFSRAIGLRTGLVLIPVGFVNEFHEPPTFNGVERPSIDRVLIPTTWREAGIGIYGEPVEGVTYRFYTVAGLNPQKVSEKGIRDARQSGYYSKSDDMAFTGRLEWLPLPGLKTGASFYTGSMEQNSLFGDTLSGVRFNLVEADIRYQVFDLSLKITGVYSQISNSDKLAHRFKNNTGKSQFGTGIEAGYNLLPAFFPESEQSALLFGRVEHYNTQQTLSSSTIRAAGTKVTEFTAGITWLPHENVALKADYQWIDSNGISTFQQKLNLGAGYYFY